MSPPPTNIDGTDIRGATIDGQDVQEITVDGQTVFTALPPGAPPLLDEVYADYNPNQQSTASPFVNQFGPGSDLFADGNPNLQSNIFGSNNGINLNGNGEAFRASAANFGTVFQPFTVYITFINDDPGNENALFTEDVNQAAEVLWDGRSTKRDWKLRGDSAQHQFGLRNPGYNDIVTVFDGSNSLVQADGDIELSNVTVNTDLSGFVVGDRPESSSFPDRFWDGKIGRILIYDTAHGASKRSNVRSYLVNEGWI